ncbi:hypothetical protein NHX12_012899 [Muraenolepis orangiensis]|uniref:Uncharacterized protein n=1 Tax=Muraenolepis orangiensis TaxID=630683 RepID=A0A9Q0DF33_9TELE|nr:hypothetical protein NHX12_012899 [Muraenolepis orangiensis]
MMDDNQQLAQRIDGAIQSASQEPVSQAWLLVQWMPALVMQPTETPSSSSPSINTGQAAREQLVPAWMERGPRWPATPRHRVWQAPPLCGGLWRWRRTAASPPEFRIEEEYEWAGRGVKWEELRDGW